MDNFEWLLSTTSWPNARFRWRPIIVAVSAVFSVALYQFSADPLKYESVIDTTLRYIMGHDWDFHAKQPTELSVFDLCSGEPASSLSFGSFYEAFGSCASQIGRDRGRYIHDAGKDARTNAFMVAHGQNAFGLIQSNTPFPQSLEEQFQLVGPLFAEVLHLVYRCDDIQHGGDRTLSVAEHPPVDRGPFGNANELLRWASDRGTVSLGSPTSGAWQLVPALATAAGVKLDVGTLSVERPPDLKCEHPPKPDSLTRQLQRLRKGDGPRTERSQGANGLDLVGFITGVPNSRFIEATDKKDESKLCLLGIHPELIDRLPAGQARGVYSTVFGEKYEGLGAWTTPTVAANALLIASLDMRSSEVHEFLGYMAEAATYPKLREASEFPPLSISNLKGKWERRAMHDWLRFASALAVFVLGVGLSTLLVMNAIERALSLYKRTRYYRRLMEIYPSIDPRASSINQKLSLEQVARGAWGVATGLQRLRSLAYQVRIDFESGGVSVAHHGMLLENIHSLADRARARMHQLMREWLTLVLPNDVATDTHALRVFRGELRQFFAANALNPMEYEALLNRSTRGEQNG